MTEQTVPPADSRDMYTVHNALRRGFHEVPDLARGLAEGDSRAEPLAGYATLLTTMLSIHHNGEDAVLWPLLQERCPDDVESLVDLMESQHHALDGFVETTNEAAENLKATGSAADAEALATAVEALAPALSDHLRSEEERVLPLIDRYLTDPEWMAVGEHGIPDVPQDLGPVWFGMMVRAATPEQLEVIETHLGPEMFGQISAIGPQALEEYEASVYPSA